MDERERMKRIYETISAKIYSVENSTANMPSFEDLQQIADRLERIAIPYSTGVVFNETLLNGGRFKEVDKQDKKNDMKFPLAPILILGRYNRFEEKGNFVFVKDGSWFVEGAWGLEELNEIVDRYVNGGHAFIYGYYLLNDCIYETVYADYRVGADDLLICDYSSEYLVRDNQSEKKNYLMTLKGVAEIRSECNHYLIYCPSMSDLYDFVLENCLPQHIEKDAEGVVIKGDIIWGFDENGLKKYTFEIDNERGNLRAYILDSRN